MTAESCMTIISKNNKVITEVISLYKDSLHGLLTGRIRTNRLDYLKGIYFLPISNIRTSINYFNVPVMLRQYVRRCAFCILFSIKPPY